MYDDLTEGDLPDPEDELAKNTLKDVTEIVSAHASTNGRASQLKDILLNPHLQVRAKGVSN